jgi:hypothetical protein
VEINREPFVGSWNVYAEASVSQLELQENGKYLHSLWDGAQSHWGIWSVQAEGSFSILRLDLQGAQPESYKGPNGPVQIQWPPFEAWAIQQIFPDHAAISILGGFLVRKSVMSGPAQTPARSEAAQPVPAPNVTNTTASASSTPEGNALIAKVMEAAGGTARLSAIHALRCRATVTEKAQPMVLEAETTWVLPDKIHHVIATPTAEITSIVTPQESFCIFKGAVTGTEVKPMQPAQRNNLLHALQSNLCYMAQHINEFAFNAQGTDSLGNVPAEVLEITRDGVQLRWYIDPQTGHILRSQSQVSGDSGPATVVIDFSDWRPVNGVTLPFQGESSSNGQPLESVVIHSYELNPTIDSAIFTRPPSVAAPAQASRAPVAGATGTQLQLPMGSATPSLLQPNPQFANILKQWADFHQAALQSALQANLESSNAMHSFAKQFTAYARS